MIRLGTQNHLFQNSDFNQFGQLGQFGQSPNGYTPVSLNGFMDAHSSLWGGVGMPNQEMNSFINAQAALMPLFQLGAALLLQNMIVQMIAQGLGQNGAGADGAGRAGTGGQGFGRSFGNGLSGGNQWGRSQRSQGWSPNPGVTMNPSGSPGVANQSALSAAQSQIGVREASGRNDGIPAQRYSGGRHEAWCANFVAWSFRQAGNPLPGNQRSLASVQRMEDRMKGAGRFHRGTPQPGDIIFFKNRGASDRGSGRHVGIVERVANGRVHTVEGNSGNAVRRRSYALNNGRISGYGR